MSIVSERASRSVQRLSIVSMIAALPFSSASAIGVAETPYIVGVTIWISGKARPMPSASTVGKPSWAAAMIGANELPPPTSTGTVAATFTPR